MRGAFPLYRLNSHLVTFHSPAIIIPVLCALRVARHYPAESRAGTLEDWYRHVVVCATHRYVLLSMFIPLHYSPFASPLCHSRLAFPVLVPSSHQPLSIYPRESRHRDPGYNYPTSLYFHSITRCLPLPYLSPTLLGPLTLVWSSWLLHLPFPVPLHHCSLASAFPTRLTLSLLVFSRPPSLALSSPALSPCPSPAGISPRRLAFTFVVHTFFGVCITLRPRVTNQYTQKCVVILRTYT